MKLFPWSRKGNQKHRIPPSSAHGQLAGHSPREFALAFTFKLVDSPTISRRKMSTHCRIGVKNRILRTLRDLNVSWPLNSLNSSPGTSWPSKIFLFFWHISSTTVSILVRASSPVIFQSTRAWLSWQQPQKEVQWPGAQMLGSKVMVNPALGQNANLLNYWTLCVD